MAALGAGSYGPYPGDWHKTECMGLTFRNDLGNAAGPSPQINPPICTLCVCTSRMVGGARASIFDRPMMMGQEWTRTAACWSGCTG